jgi:hypothetical protein
MREEMVSEKQMVREAREAWELLIKQNPGVDFIPKAWIVQVLIGNLKPALVEDGPLRGRAMTSIHTAAHVYVLKAISTLKQRGAQADPDQMDLVGGGFKYLQKSYPTERDGEVGVSPIESMSYQQLSEKIREHERMGAGNYAHARELKTYRDRKFGKRSGGVA